MKPGLLPTFILLAVIALLIYANSIENEFVFDDIPLIAKNQQIKKIENIPRLLGLTGQRPYYRPLRMVSYVLDYHFFKLTPAGYHLSNIFLHVLTGWLVFLLALHLSRNYGTALTVSLLFIVHPIHTENVAYISGRRDILATLFYLLGFYLFLKYRKTENRFLLPCIIFSYLLAVLSKEMAVTLPAVLLAYDLIEHFPGRDNRNILPALYHKFLISIKNVLQKYTFFYLSFFVVAALFVYYKVVIAPPTHGYEYYGGHLWTNFFTVARILVYYLKLLFFPIVLNADYSFNAFSVTDSFKDISAWASICLLCLILWAGISAFGRNRMLTFSILWFFITLLPVCHIIPHHELLAEHYLYLPSFGICFIAGTFIHNFLKNKSSLGYYTFLGIVLVLLSLRTIDRNSDWKNAMTLWKKTVTTAPACARAWNNLGVEYYQAREIENAEKAYLKALKIKPAYPDPYHNLGNIMAKRNFFDEARNYYLKAHRYSRGKAKKKILNSWGILYKKTGNPKSAKLLFARALSFDPFFQEALNNLAAVLHDQGRYLKAWGILTKALQIDPNSPEVHNNLGNVYKKTEHMSKAIEEFRKAVLLKPDFMEAHNNLGNALKAEGRYDEAIEEFNICIGLKPDSAPVYTNLGNAFRKAGQNEKAVIAFNKALELNPRLALPYLNLAIIYLSQDRDIDKALFYLKKTVELDPSIPQAEAIKKKIASLEQNRS